MAANCFNVTTKTIGGQPSVGTMMINKARCTNVTSEDSGNDCTISYNKYPFPSGAENILVDDTYSTIKTTLGTQYSYGKKFEVAVLVKGNTTYPSATNMELSTDNVVWAIADPAAAGTQSLLFYIDPFLGFTQYKVLNTLAGLITLTTT